ncbi:MAG: phage integrase SAM-like domain-containing protein [Bacteroidetes bacterium]|nr:phage integrase SAM-like domain-containing protein [Bacteroidota bacterium]
MATINFLYRSTKETSTLVLRLLYRHNEKDFVHATKTNLQVSKHYWVKEHKQKRPKDIEISNRQQEVNTELNNISNHILKAFDETDIIMINKEWLQNQTELYYNPRQEKEIPTNLISYIDFYLEYRKHEIKPTSIKKYNVIKHKLERMQTERKKTILISNIDESFKNEFIAYQKKNGYAQNTIQREIAIIKTFCKHARYLGLETSHQLDKIKVDKAKAEKIYLDFKELDAIEKTVFEHDFLENARDWLIISCYTGQRVSDFLRFTKDMIRTENGKQLLEFTQKKTDKLMTVPLHKKVLQILDKRNGEFPRQISDQRYNEYIKKVCELSKINKIVQGGKQTETDNGIRKVTGNFQKWELVTSHIGRRSFATNFYGSIPTSYLIYITGHSSEAMFLNYIGKSNKDLAMEISNYF